MKKEANPVQTGKYHSLTLGGSRKQFRILKLEDQEFLIPSYEVPENLKTGETMRAFVFLDGKNGLKATTAEAKAEVGDFASLEVKSVTDFGVFLDWGIKKDLFVPKAFLRKDLVEGEIAIVCLIPDFDGVGVIGSCQIDEFLEEGAGNLKEKQKVELLVFGISELGYRVIVANRFKALLYRNEVFEEIRFGEKKQGYIKKIREDGLIDVTLQAPGFRSASKEACDKIMKALEETGGYLPLNDKSSPDDIKNRLQMSKKNFKKSVGILYKEKKIRIEDQGISLPD